MAKSAGRPAGLLAKTGQCTRLAATPSVTKSCGPSWSNVVPDAITPPRVARSITRAATLTSPPEPIGRQPLRSTGMDPHPHSRLVAVDVDRFQRSLGLQDRTDRN